ncbi:MAG: NADP-dependent oxidoreductase [Betaproteobacteria bacterium]|nr:NADP-dependent oxidoreductase [Betaproteobacteria bacterium]
MKAAVIRAFGPPSVLQIETVPRPEPSADEVLVKVHAAGINPIDYKTRLGTGANRGWKDIPFPVILGWDISGEVVESRAPGFAPGDEVYAMSRFPAAAGGYAEYISVPSADLVPKPRSLDHVHAAAVPLAALTAWQALIDNAGLSAGQTVLIHAAAGGVGHLAVQLAKHIGARVVATASARNAEFVKSLGADQFIDYTQTRFEDHVRDVDAVFHTISADQRPRSWSVLRKGGRLVSITGPIAEDEPLQYGATGGFTSVRPNAKQLAEIGRLIDAGILRITVEATYALQDIVRAHEHVERGRTRGKVVISPIA